MIRILQIVITPEMVDDINELGHDGGAAKYPAYEAYLRNSLGAERFREEDLEYFQPVAEVDSDDLMEAFTISNGLGDQSRYRILPDAQARSLSVGDVVDLNGELHIVDTFGYRAVSEL